MVETATEVCLSCNVTTSGLRRYHTPVMRHVLIVGLIVLAALLPLAMPIAIFVFDVAFVVVGVALCVSVYAQTGPLLALASSRAPPSH
jgi:hypothetical protein